MAVRVGAAAGGVSQQAIRRCDRIRLDDEQMVERRYDYTEREELEGEEMELLGEAAVAFFAMRRKEVRGFVDSLDAIAGSAAALASLGDADCGLLADFRELGEKTQPGAFLFMFVYGQLVSLTACFVHRCERVAREAGAHARVRVACLRRPGVRGRRGRRRRRGQAQEGQAGLKSPRESPKSPRGNPRTLSGGSSTRAAARSVTSPRSPPPARAPRSTTRFTTRFATTSGGTKRKPPTPRRRRAVSRREILQVRFYFIFVRAIRLTSCFVHHSVARGFRGE